MLLHSRASPQPTDQPTNQPTAPDRNLMELFDGVTCCFMLALKVPARARTTGNAGINMYMQMR